MLLLYGVRTSTVGNGPSARGRVEVGRQVHAIAHPNGNMKTVVHIVVCLHEPVPLQRYEMSFQQLPADRG